MELIADYIKHPLAYRQSHLALDEGCDERGGYSTLYKGLLAHFLDTTIPKGIAIQVCHACHNAFCSNPRHLYWGTQTENRRDSIANGATSLWERTVLKHGIEVATEMARQKDMSKAGKGNKGKPKSEEHKRKIAEALRKK